VPDRGDGASSEGARHGGHDGVPVLLSAMTRTGTTGPGRRGELLTDGFGVGHVNLGGQRDNDRLAGGMDPMLGDRRNHS
jgi:hypothetical protein